MNTGRKIQGLFILFALVFSGVFLSYRLVRDHLTETRADSGLYIHFLDVGQGDASLIRTEAGQNILIDGGPGRAGLEPLSRVLPWHERTIDLMVLTHPHDDHVAGLVPVLENYQVEKVVYTGLIHTAPAFLRWLEIIKEQKIPLMIIDRPQTIVLAPDCRLEIIYPRENFAGRFLADINNSSIVIRLIHRGRSVLFMGDAEKEVETQLLEAGIVLRSDIIKAGHHGSETSSSQEFIAAVQPEYAVISAGTGNKFGHPSLRVLRRYERAGTAILRTDTDGTISFVSDGEGLRRAGP